MPSIFSRIVAGEIPCYKVAETAEHLAFLDVNPNAVGHVLCIPKAESDKLFHLEPAAYQALMAFAYNVAQAVEKAIPCKRVGMAVVGLEVPHVHVHLIPLQHMDDFRFVQKVQLTPETFEATAAAIAAAMAS